MTPTRRFIARNLESLVKTKLSDNVLLMEYSTRNSIYFVLFVLNGNYLKYKMKLNFSKLSNLSCLINEKIIQPGNFDYFELSKTPNQTHDYEFTISMKSFN